MFNKQRKLEQAGWLVLFLFSVSAMPAMAQSKRSLNEAVKTAEKTNRASAKSQKRISSLDNQTQKLLERYRAANWKAQQLQLYVKQLEQMIGSQEDKLDSLLRQIEEIEVTQREVLPLMERMVESLEKFVALDLPFKVEERESKVRRLKKLLIDADRSVADKYRNVLEAFQREVDYGRSIEAYQEELKIGRSERIVDVLRVGRIGLYYLTLNGEEGGWWNRAKGKWQPLPEANRLATRQAIRKGLKIAEDKSVPALITLPVPAPEKSS